MPSIQVDPLEQLFPIQLSMFVSQFKPRNPEKTERNLANISPGITHMGGWPVAMINAVL